MQLDLLSPDIDHPARTLALVCDDVLREVVAERPARSSGRGPPCTPAGPEYTDSG
jgi:hypothetical protein